MRRRIFPSDFGSKCSSDMGPLAKVRPKNGSGFALDMGLDGAVWRSGLD